MRLLGRTFGFVADQAQNVTVPAREVLNAFLISDRAPGMLGWLAGFGGFITAWVAEGDIPAEFYAACAQVVPVFLIALVVEQRLADRLGISEDEWTTRGHDAWASIPRDPISAVPAWREWEARWPDYKWVIRFDADDEREAEARRRYRRTAALQSRTVIYAVVALAACQVTSMVGVASNGTATASVIFLVTVSCLAGAATMIVVSALTEMLRRLRS